MKNKQAGDKMKRYNIVKENINKGDLILVNKEYPLKTKIEEELISFNKEYKDILISKKLNSSIQEIFKKLKLKNEIVPVSGYRTLEEQIEIFNTSKKENGEEFTLKYVALPNASEHQTGLAIDLGLNQKEIDFIRPSFPHNGVCESFRKLAASHGLIERYQEEKEKKTGISSEEWHFRYIGIPHAKIMEEKNLCLEEYLIYLKDFNYPTTPLKYEAYQIFYLPYKKDTYLEINKEFTISGNNIDGFILTIKEQEDE